MFQDAKEMFATDLAYGGTPEVVDLKTTAAGPGRPLRVQFNGNGLAGTTGVKLVHGTTSSPATDLVEFDFSAAELNAGVTFTVPQTVDRYITIALVGSSTAGTYTAGMACQEGQTNL